MNVKYVITSLIGIITLLTLVIIIVSTYPQTIVAANIPEGNAVYIFAEGVYPQATFKFRDAEVKHEFQAFSQVNNLFSSVNNFQTRQTSPEFTLQRIVGDTPYLHRAVDQTFEYNGKNSGFDYPFKQFDVTVEMIQAGKSIRTFEYGDCSITNYKITTEFDKEEGYTTGGKTGFAIMETYTLACSGYTPIAPSYEKIMEEKQNAKPYQ